MSDTATYSLVVAARSPLTGMIGDSRSGGIYILRLTTIYCRVYLDNAGITVNNTKIASISAGSMSFRLTICKDIFATQELSMSALRLIDLSEKNLTG